VSDDQTVSLGSVTTWFSGGTPARAVPAYWGGDIPWISGASLKQARISDSPQRLTAAGLAAGSRMAPTDAVLLLVRGMALHNEVRVGVTTRPVSFNQDVKALVANASAMPEFLAYAIRARTPEVLRLVTSAGSGTGVLNTDALKRLRIWLPDPPRQRAIVSALRDCDDLVSTLENAIRKKSQIRDGVAHALLLGETRLPGYTHEWRPIRLADLLDFKNGLNKAKQYFGAGTPIVNFTDALTKSSIHASDLQGLVTLDSKERERFSARAGDLFFTRTSESVAEVGTAAVLLDDVAGATFSGFLLRGRPKSSDADSHFLAYRLRHPSARRQIQSTASYTTRALTNGGSLGRVGFLLPRRDEQEAIKAAIVDCDNEIRSLGLRLTKLVRIREGMTEALLTGRTSITPEKES
jgi:type I restriction enzyme S subunit